MKRRTASLGFGALLVVSTSLLYCGGENIDSTPGGNAGSGNTSGPTSGSGGGATSGTTSSGVTSGTSTTSGGGGSSSTTGGTAGARPTTGSGGAGGATTGGTGGAGPGAGACPAQVPNNAANCTAVGDVCDYTGFVCSCVAVGMTRDGGMRDGWLCIRVRPDGGAPGGGNGGDAGACPRVAPNNGGMCMTAGEVCPYANETCTCAMGGGMVDRWACTFAGADGGRRGGGG